MTDPLAYLPDSCKVLDPPLREWDKLECWVLHENGKTRFHGTLPTLSVSGGKRGACDRNAKVQLSIGSYGILAFPPDRLAAGACTPRFRPASGLLPAPARMSRTSSYLPPVCPGPRFGTFLTSARRLPPGSNQGVIPPLIQPCCRARLGDAARHNAASSVEGSHAR